MARNGNRAWELESLPTEQLRSIVEATLRGVLNLDAFEREVAQEEREQQELNAKRRRLRQLLVADVEDGDDCSI